MRRLGLTAIGFAVGFAFGLGSSALAQPVVPATEITLPITVSTAAAVKIISGIAGHPIYVTNWNIIAAGITTVQWVSGTGTNCATSQVPLTGAYSLIAQVGLVVGVGYGAVLAVPPGQDLCIVNGAAIGIPGSISYAVF